MIEKVIEKRQRYKGTERERYKVTEIQRYRETEIQRDNNMKNLNLEPWYTIVVKK